MRLRQHTDLNLDRPDGSQIAPVYPRLTVEHPLTHQVFLNFTEHSRDVVNACHRIVASGKLSDR